MRGCWFASCGTSSAPCDLGVVGRLHHAHIVSQRVIKREHQTANPRLKSAWFEPTQLTGTDLDELLADSDLWMWACQACHHRADHGFDPFPAPAPAQARIRNLGLDSFLPPRILWVDALEEAA